MRLEQLQAFLAVAETGNFQQAARTCGVTQSTISRQIQALEADLGVLLFHRSANAKLTVGGERFLLRARKICQEWANATQELADLMAGKQPELCVAAIPSICAHALPPVLQQFCTQYPTVQLRVTSLGSDRALKVLRDGLVDLAIVMQNRALAATGEMVVDLLFEEPIQVLMSAHHPLAEYGIVPWKAIAAYSQVVFKDGYGMQRLVQEMFVKQGIALRAALELNTLDAFRGVIRQGQLIALLPDSALIEARLDPTLAIRPLMSNLVDPTAPPPLTRSVVAVTTRDRLQIPPIEYFRRLLLETIPAEFGLKHQSSIALRS